MSIVSVWHLLLIVLYNGLASTAVCPDACNLTTSNVVTFAAILSSESAVISKVAKVAIEAAVEDVNSDPVVLSGTKLNVMMFDTNYSGFLGIVEALKFMEKDKVAIVSSQGAEIAPLIAHIANELKTPLLSFSVTDPTFSPLQFPFFVRTTQNDLFQMAAIADMVEYYGWKEVNAIYVDDEHGRSGISALGDKLAEKRCRISYKAPLKNSPSSDDIKDTLVKVKSSESRIIVVHVYASWGLKVFEAAKSLGMMRTGYAWIATNWLTNILDSNPLTCSEDTDYIDGTLTLRMYTPDSQQKKKFLARWSNLTSAKAAEERLKLNTYGLYAYDTVWLLARGLDAFLKQGGKTTLSKESRLSKDQSSNINLDCMRTFDGGNLLLSNILKVNMTGVTGPFAFTPERNLIRPAYEVINVMCSGAKRIGLWSNSSGLSDSTPEMLYTKLSNPSSPNPRLRDPFWPGQTPEKPRGWVPKTERKFKIGVPNRVTYKSFVSQEQGNRFTGYCIDVFNAVLKSLPYRISCQFQSFGDGLTNPSHDELVQMVSQNAYDVAVGDIAITTDRMSMADFTTQYIDSGLVVVGPVKKMKPSAWAFLKPFAPTTWIVTAVFFFIIGAVFWILEHKVNNDFQGPPTKQLVTILSFGFSSFSNSQRERMVSAPGRLVLVVWLFVVSIIHSTYTASLSSILTVQQLDYGIDSLTKSNDPMGYQPGSLAWDYMINELKIQESRLVPLNSEEEYAIALENGPDRGGVAAVIDERAYAELFLSTYCGFQIVGPQLTKGGWGFAFPRDSPLASDMSKAISELSKNGTLQKIKEKWFKRNACTPQGKGKGRGRGQKLNQNYQVPEQKNQNPKQRNQNPKQRDQIPNQIPLRNFEGLYIINGSACLLALFTYFFKTIRLFRYRYATELTGKSLQFRIRKFVSFVFQKEDTARDRRLGTGPTNTNTAQDEATNDSKPRNVEPPPSEGFEMS